MSRSLQPKEVFYKRKWILNAVQYSNPNTLAWSAGCSTTVLVVGLAGL
jgi:hypothetical protein